MYYFFWAYYQKTLNIKSNQMKRTFQCHFALKVRFIEDQKRYQKF